MMRLYSGCGTRRLTSTTIVLVILVETTWPTFSFLNDFLASVSAMLFVRSGQGRTRGPLPQNGIHPGAVLLHRAGLLEAFHLPHGHLKLKTKKLIVHFSQFVTQFVVVKTANVFWLHISLLHVVPAQEAGLDRQLVGRQPHGGSRSGTIHAFH